MHTTESSPGVGGPIGNRTAALRLGVTALLIAAGLALLGVSAAGAVAVDEPVPAVQPGARPAQFR